MHCNVAVCVHSAAAGFDVCVSRVRSSSAKEGNNLITFRVESGDAYEEELAWLVKFGQVSKIDPEITTPN